jgi:hypothetical protein
MFANHSADVHMLCDKMVDVSPKILCLVLHHFTILPAGMKSYVIWLA